MSPLLSDHVSPTGLTLRVTSPAAQLARIAELRAGALATPISNEWDEICMATYLFYLDETEAGLRANE